MVAIEQLRATLLAAQAWHFGHMIGVRYGEPFVTREVAAVEDIVNMPVKSI